MAARGRMPLEGGVSRIGGLLTPTKPDRRGNFLKPALLDITITTALEPESCWKRGTRGGKMKRIAQMLLGLMLLFAGPNTADRMVSTTCRGTWAITPDVVKGNESVHFVGDAPAPASQARQ